MADGIVALCVIFLFVDIVLAAWTYLDAKNRGSSGGAGAGWALLVFIIPLIGIILYVALRPSGSVIRCANCKRSVLKTLPKCPHCGVMGRVPPQRQVAIPQPRPVVQQPMPQPRPQPIPQQRAPAPQQQAPVAPQAQPKVEKINCPHCNAAVEKGWKTCPFCSKKIEKETTIIDEVFLMYKDGRLIKHFTRRLKPDVDQDILSGMLTAVQDFIKDTFRGETGELDEMKFGRFQILMGRGRFVTIAAVMFGEEVEPFRPQITKVIDDIEDDYEVMLRDWDGDVDKMKVLGRYINDLIDGRYA